jgi:CheY-like chemotaxis protein
MSRKVTPRILVVEDDSMFRETVREVLRDLGYKVRGARSLSKATKRLTRHSFDLVLSDIDIGDGTGLDVVQIARKSHPDAPIVLMSANADTEVIQQALDSGVARFLPKPFGLAELMNTISELLDGPAQELPDNGTKSQAR